MKVGNSKQLLMALAALVVGAGSVSAQSSSGFDKPLKSGQPGTSAGSGGGASGGLSGTTFMMMTQDDGDDHYEIRLQDGKVTAKRNGKEVPQDRIVREKDKIKILDENGKVVNTFQMSDNGAVGFGGNGAQWRSMQPTTPAPGARGAGKARGGMRVAPAAPPEPPTDMPGWEAPKVMLGINMSEPGPDLQKAYGLEKGQAILIDRVIEGLPAEKAGIKENDVITEIDGKKPATPESLREALKEKDPGDTVTFTVMRKGGDQTIRVKLEPFDAEKLGGMMNVPAAPVAPEEIIRGLKGLSGGEAQRWLRDNQGHAFVMDAPGNEKLDAKMAELDKKLAELDKKMAKLDELFAKLQEQLEKLPKNDR